MKHFLRKHVIGAQVLEFDSRGEVREVQKTASDGIGKLGNKLPKRVCVSESAAGRCSTDLSVKNRLDIYLTR